MEARALIEAGAEHLEASECGKLDIADCEGVVGAVVGAIVAYLITLELGLGPERIGNRWVRQCHILSAEHTAVGLVVNRTAP